MVQRMKETTRNEMEDLKITILHTPNPSSTLKKKIKNLNNTFS
jgi:hypothetical protein